MFCAEKLCGKSVWKIRVENVVQRRVLTNVVQRASHMYCVGKIWSGGVGGAKLHSQAKGFGGSEPYR